MTPSERDILHQINRRGKLHTAGMVALLVWLAVLTAAVFGQSSETWAAAVADRNQLAAIDWPYTFYLSTDHLRDVDQITAGRTLAFVVSSFSTATVLEQHLPIEVRRGLWRIDLRALNWRWQDWHAVLKRYPYRPDRFPPLVVRADWLCVELTDNFESDAGYRLLYGKNIPKTLKDFENFWNARRGKPELALLHVEGESGVSLLHIRWIENGDTPDRGYYWRTEDNAKRNFNAKTDPLESLLDSQRGHDASEAIVGFAKLSVAQGAGGAAQAYLLANGAGVRQDRAPVDIVEDGTRFRGLAEIRNSGSCIQCHASGINPLNRNDLRELIAGGEELYADKKSQQLIEQQYLADVRLRVEIARNQEDYATFVALATGWPPEENARAFKALVGRYDAVVDLETAAREVYLSPPQLMLALGYASEKQVKLDARLAGLAHGRTVPRDYFESEFSTIYYAAQAWRNVAK